MKRVKVIFMLAAMAVLTFGAFVAPLTVVEAHTRTVKIKVDQNGFSPSSIDAEAGHKLNLVFNRAAGSNCGNVVVFPKLKIRKSLPVGRDVIVSVTPRTSGQIAFACGMGMYKGTIVITDG